LLNEMLNEVSQVKFSLWKTKAFISNSKPLFSMLPKLISAPPKPD
jgi:hypothetical protein